MPTECYQSLGANGRLPYTFSMAPSAWPNIGQSQYVEHAPPPEMCPAVPCLGLSESSEGIRQELLSILERLAIATSRDWAAELVVTQRLCGGLLNPPLPGTEFDLIIERQRSPVTTHNAKSGQIRESERFLCLSKADLAAFALYDDESPKD